VWPLGLGLQHAGEGRQLRGQLLLCVQGNGTGGKLCGGCVAPLCGGCGGGCDLGRVWLLDCGPAQQQQQQQCLLTVCLIFDCFRQQGLH
jgi:hypothetical protein